MEKDASYYQACAWAQGQLAAGTHPELLVTSLKNQGWEESQARQVLDGAIAGVSPRPAPVMAYASPVQSRSRGVSSASAGSSRHTKNMLIGGVICAIGLVITVGTYASATSGGGTYTICWGAILFGGIRFIRGFIGWTSGS